MQRLTTCAALAALLLASAGAAQAAPAKKAAAPAAPVATQAATPRPTTAAAPPINHGPPIPNMCLYSNDRALGLSSVGKAASTRMQQLRAQVTAELQGEQTALQTDASALRAKNVPETDAQWNPLRQRAQALDAKAAQRQRELEATGTDALTQINTRVNAILPGIYQQRGCSILLNGEAVVTANPAMDLTDAVVAQLNTQMPTITFDRKTLPAQPQQ